MIKLKIPEPNAQGLYANNKCIAFFHPDFTVGFGISPNQRVSPLADFDRRYGISPIPEDFI